MAGGRLGLVGIDVPAAGLAQERPDAIVRRADRQADDLGRRELLGDLREIRPGRGVVGGGEPGRLPQLRVDLQGEGREVLRRAVRLALVGEQRGEVRVEAVTGELVGVRVEVAGLDVALEGARVDVEHVGGLVRGEPLRQLLGQVGRGEDRHLGLVRRRPGVAQLLQVGGLGGAGGPEQDGQLLGPGGLLRRAGRFRGAVEATAAAADGGEQAGAGGGDAGAAGDVGHEDSFMGTVGGCRWSGVSGRRPAGRGSG